jgi:hypothetical protein
MAVSCVVFLGPRTPYIYIYIYIYIWNSGSELHNAMNIMCSLYLQQHVLAYVYVHHQVIVKMS